MSDSSGGGGFSWFLAGLGLGSLLGVLYAPRPGQETREELVATALGSSEYVRQRSREAQQNAGEYVSRGKGQVTEYVSRGKEQLNQYANACKGQINQYVERSKDAVEAGRQKINEVYSQSAQAVAEQKEKLAASYEAGKQAYIETPAPAASKEELIPSTEKSS